MYNFLEELSLSETQFLISKTQHAVLLIKELLAFAKVVKFPLQAEKGGAGGLSQEEHQRRRGKPRDLGIDSFEEVYKIAMSEKASEESQYSVQAYQLIAKLGALNAAALRDATLEEILKHMIQLGEENGGIVEDNIQDDPHCLKPIRIVRKALPHDTYQFQDLSRSIRPLRAC